MMESFKKTNCYLSSVRKVFPSPEIGIRNTGPPISSFSVRNAVDVGQSFLTNVTNTVRRTTTKVRKNTADELHSKNAKRRKGVKRQNELALIAAEAAQNLVNTGTVSSNEIGLRLTDTSNTVLENCYGNPNCNFNDKFRKIDGTCNNRRQPLFGALRTPLQRVLRNAYGNGINTPRTNSVRN